MQGVGFRPFVYRLAISLGLSGWVSNSSHGVVIEVEGPETRLRDLLRRVEEERPPHSSVQGLEATWLDAAGYVGFEVRESVSSGAPTALVLPDIATCPECLAEVLDPANRRYRYPFTNCTRCGPRYSIVEALPYDRCNTTMSRFTMCAACQAEYDDPLDRRFHAQPNACPDCGPWLDLWEPEGQVLRSRHEALLEAAEAIRLGRIVAVKGVGGFHLVVDARSDDAVRRLRERKRREEKPLALMCPSIESVHELCVPSPLEEELLRSPQAPIVILRRRSGAGVAESVAPGNPTLGVMLPYAPLHHLLLRELGFPVVATSGNLSDEPIATDEREALSRLRGIADLFLVHNRPIVRHVDDSILREMAGREVVLRRARGFAPLPVPCRGPAGRLAVGAHLKNAVALSVGGNAFVSQHVGDLETAEAFAAMGRTVETLRGLYRSEPRSVACDLHPDYLSTRYAERLGLPIVRVQHHHAHVLSCMADNGIAGRVLGVAWDGTGFGTDGTVWGGEFLRVEGASFERVAHLRAFRLPGGEKAVREPRRSALGLLHELVGSSTSSPAFTAVELQVLRGMLDRRVHSPLTSSMGRLFDAVASITGVRHVAHFEGQAAIELEYALGGVVTDEAYPLPLVEGVLDWGPMVERVLADVGRAVPVGLVSARFHNALVEGLLAVVARTGEGRIVLTGGCFQNRYLTERAVRRLREGGFTPFWHRQVPPNDGGIALGQLCATGEDHVSGRPG